MGGRREYAAATVKRSSHSRIESAFRKSSDCARRDAVNYPPGAFLLPGGLAGSGTSRSDAIPAFGRADFAPRSVGDPQFLQALDPVWAAGRFGTLQSIRRSADRAGQCGNDTAYRDARVQRPPGCPGSRSLSNCEGLQAVAVDFCGCTMAGRLSLGARASIIPRNLRSQMKLACRSLRFSTANSECGEHLVLHQHTSPKLARRCPATRDLSIMRSPVRDHASVPPGVIRRSAMSLTEFTRQPLFGQKLSAAHLEQREFPHTAGNPIGARDLSAAKYPC